MSMSRWKREEEKEQVLAIYSFDARSQEVLVEIEAATSILKWRELKGTRMKGNRSSSKADLCPSS